MNNHFMLKGGNLYAVCGFKYHLVCTDVVDFSEHSTTKTPLIFVKSGNVLNFTINSQDIIGVNLVELTIDSIYVKHLYSIDLKVTETYMKYADNEATYTLL